MGLGGILSDPRSRRGERVVTNQFDLCFPCVLHREGVGNIKIGGGILEQEKSLVWPFGGFPFLRREDDLEVVCGTEFDGGGDGFLGSESACV